MKRKDYRLVNLGCRVIALRPGSINVVVPSTTLNIRRHFSLDFNNKNSAKVDFILTAFSTDFPAYSYLTYDQIISLGGKSASIGNWLKTKYTEFQVIQDTPAWFGLEGGLDDNNWTMEFRQKLNEAALLRKEMSTESNKASEIARKRLDEINDTYKKKLLILFKEQPELLIHYITTQILPIEIHLHSMTFKDINESKAYIQEQLLLEKKSLFNKYKSGILSSDDLVNLLFVKL